MATFFVSFFTLESFLASSDNFRPFLGNLGPFFFYISKRLKSLLTVALVLLYYLEIAVLLVSLVSFLPQK